MSYNQYGGAPPGGAPPAHSPPRSRDQSPPRDPFMASHENLAPGGGPGNYGMSSLSAPQGPGSFTTGSNYGTAPSSPYDTPAGNYGRAAGSFGQNTQPPGYPSNSYGGQSQRTNNYGGSGSSVQLTDFGAVDHDSVPHGAYPHEESEENRPLNEGAGFSGGFYPPPGGPGR